MAIPIVAVSTAVVTGICVNQQEPTSNDLEWPGRALWIQSATHCTRRHSILHLHVVCSDECAETARRDVLIDEECANWCSGGGQVGRGLEGVWLEEEHKDISMGSRALGRSRAGVVGAEGCQRRRVGENRLTSPLTCCCRR